MESYSTASPWICPECKTKGKLLSSDGPLRGRDGMDVGSKFIKRTFRCENAKCSNDTFVTYEEVE
jgi:hypothetical protein